MARVFLSYRHDNEQQTARVRNLAVRLEAAGVAVVLDQFAQEREFRGGGPDGGWPRWSKDQAKSTDHKILIVGTESWFRVYEQTEVPGKGLGAAAEATIIETRIYNDGGRMKDIRVLAFGDLQREAIPLDLQRNHIFNVETAFEQMVQWLTGAAPPAPAVKEWPESAPPLSWVVADYERVRKAFAELITRSPAYRYLPIRGASETAKSHIARQFLGNAMRCEGLDCARFDCKGAADRDGEFDRVRQTLDITVTAATSALNHRFGALLAELSRRQRPCLLIFDTFEEAGELRSWVEDTLLVALIRFRWLRVVVLGQQVPERGGKPWDAESHETLVLTAPEASHWYDFSRPYKPTLTRDQVQLMYDCARGRGSLLFQLLGPQAAS